MTPAISLNVRDVEREDLEVDVLLVGAGPAALACAIQLKRRLTELGLDKSILVLEKAEEVGYHTLSGAVMDPRGMAELFPDWKQRGCPVEADVAFDCVDFLRKNGKQWRFQGPFVPPPLRNHGNSIVSLYKVVRWMKDEAEKLGIDVYPGFAAAEVLYDESGKRVLGVQTRDAGVGKGGVQKSTFQPGMNIKAAVTVFAEGTRGHLAKQHIAKLGLDANKNPQIYETGIKEVWEIPEARGNALLGSVIHTLGEPLGTSGYGGGWIYGLAGSRLSIGYVVGLDHPDPRLDPHALFVRWKQHPALQQLLAGGKALRYGAKTIPGGGYWSMPKLYGDGHVLVGDTAGFVNMSRLKGIHLAIKSGLLAADAIATALQKSDTSASALASYAAAFETSWAKTVLWGVRNFRAAFANGWWTGFVDAGIQQVTKGRGLLVKRTHGADHEHRDKLDALGTSGTSGTSSSARMSKPTFNATDALDKLTDVYLSGAVHEEDQPAHLIVRDPDLCSTRCTIEYGNPCKDFCPAAVYEWPGDAGAKAAAAHAVAAPAGALHAGSSHASAAHAGAAQAQSPQRGPIINFSNCVHCKTCDIADPYQIIEWVVPEGGGGPKYIDM